MQRDSVEPFSNNWAYLRTELNWLDRLLSIAIAKQRQETKTLDRVSRSRADRATSHWWKGLVNLEGEPAYDSPAVMPPQRAAASKISYQQQLESKIQASLRQGIGLGLPMLRDRLQLNPFEKNLVLMALAPEMSRRYGRLYNYLQETEQATGLPSVDLVLRLLCRNDADWRSARQCLTDTGTLMQHGLLDMPPVMTEALLTRPVKLADALVNYLLADIPTAERLEALLGEPKQPIDRLPNLPSMDLPEHSAPSLLTNWVAPALTATDRPDAAPSASVAIAQSGLILPAALFAELQHLCDRFQWADQVDRCFAQAFQAPNHRLQIEPLPGAIALCIGASGTGKTMAARAIAQALRTTLVYADLSLLTPADQARLLREIAQQSAAVVLLKSAALWFGRSPSLPERAMHQFLRERRQTRSLTLLSVTQKQTVTPRWRQAMNVILEFPLPDASMRLQLWQQALPKHLYHDTDIDWLRLALLRLTGGEIQAIARDAAIAAIAHNDTMHTAHLLQACDRLKGKTRARPASNR